MHFDSDGILVKQVFYPDFWSKESYVSYKPVWWFPGNWIMIPFRRAQRKLKEMQSLHYDE